MFSKSEAAWDVLRQVLDKIQGNDKIRRTLAIILVAALLGLTLFFIYGLLPKKYTLTISGGDILTNRHHLARVLQSEAPKSGLTLEIEPISGSMNIVKAVSEGWLDLAIIQGGLEKKMANVAHVAMLPPETMHIIVKPEIMGIEDLKGKTINMGSTGGGTRIVAKEILNFFNLKENRDFVEKNYTDEELFNMNSQKLPDAIISVSYIPSYVADYFVKQCGYTLLDLPYSASLGLRYAWAKEGLVAQGTYNTAPAVPAEDMITVGVEPEIIANTYTSPRAISMFLEVLYNSSVKNTIKQALIEENGNSFSVYPLSTGTIAYVNRNEPFLSLDKADDIKNLFGSLMAGLSTLIVVVRWFRGDRKKEKTSEFGGSDSKH
jgi:hypothetical protein